MKKVSRKTKNKAGKKPGKRIRKKTLEALVKLQSTGKKKPSEGKEIPSYLLQQQRKGGFRKKNAKGEGLLEKKEERATQSQGDIAKELKGGSRG